MFNMLLDFYRTNYDTGLWHQTFPHLFCYWWIHNVSFTESPKSSPAKTPKKVKVEEYKLTREQKTLIKNDTANKKVWDEAMQSLSLGPVRRAAYLYTVNKFLICERWKCVHVLLFVSAEILKQSWRSFPLHLLSRSGLSTHHHRVPTQCLSGTYPTHCKWNFFIFLMRNHFSRSDLPTSVFYFLNSRNAFKGLSKRRYTPALRAGMTWAKITPWLSTNPCKTS